MISTALFSDCKKYRYTLTRIWDPRKSRVVFIMLNPSTADAIKDDPTIKRCMSYADSFGYGGMIVLNLFAYRSTNPKLLPPLEYAVGTDNDNHIAMECISRPVICAWGVDGKKWDRDREVMKIIKSHALSIRCLAITQNGFPGHPLYLSKGLVLLPYEGRR